MQFSSTRFLFAAASLLSAVFADDTTEPSISGSLVDGKPTWEVAIPGKVSHWQSVEISVSNNGSSGFFDYNSAQIRLPDETGDYSSHIKTSVSASSISASYDTSIGEYSTLYLDFDAIIRSGTEFTTSVDITIYETDSRLAKRAALTFHLTSTISSDSSSSDELSTSTTTTDEQSSTVITITSCDVTTCTEEPVTTGVTVITETISGVVTEYTTYCPLTTSTPGNYTTIGPSGTQSNNYTTIGPSGTQSGTTNTFITIGPSGTQSGIETTVITITSCEENKCTETTATTGITTITTTDNGGISTTYTTYCPIPTESYTTVGPSGTPSGTQISKTETYTSSNVISTYEAGAAGKAAITTGFFGVLAAVFFL